MSAPSPDPAPVDELATRSSNAPPRDFSELAKRISGRTTDLFALALVLVILLYMGTRLTQWWRAEPPAVVAAPADAPLAIWDSPANLTVEFDAGPWRLTRSHVGGAAEDIIRLAITAARTSLESSQNSELPPPDNAEQQWLNQLREWPAQEVSEVGEIFVLGGPWPWIVATRSEFAGTVESRDASHASDSRRVICWSFALPQSPSHWTLYAAERAHGAAANTSTAEIAVPDHAQRLLTAHSAVGGITGFRSEQDLREVRDDWERTLVAAGWRQSGNWSGDNQTQRAIFKRQAGGVSRRLEAALTRDNHGATTGLADWRIEQPHSVPVP